MAIVAVSSLIIFGQSASAVEYTDSRGVRLP